jgi:DNA-binding CsgD family transcriptional regulator
VNDLAEAGRWLERAAAVATAAPTSTRTRLVEFSRAMLAAAAGDIAGTHRHFGLALEHAPAQERRAARCEILAAYGSACIQLHDATADPALLDEAETWATDAKRLAASLPGHALWGPQADATLAVVLMARGNREGALALARAALAARQTAEREEPHFELLLPVARVILEAGRPNEIEAIRFELQLLQGLIAQRTLDDQVRAAWFRAPVGQELSRLAGEQPPVVRERAEGATAGDSSAMSAEERRLLNLLVQGRTNAEIAAELGVAADEVGRNLAGMYARIGATSRAEATVLALSGAV